MAYRIQWVIENHLSFTPVWDEMDADELRRYDAEAGAMLDQVTKPLVHTIFDYSHLKRLPALQDMLALKSGKHPKVGWVIFCSVPNPMLKFVASATSQIFRLRLRFVDTTDQALAFLQDVDSTLPDLSGVDLDALAAEIRARPPAS